MYERQHIAIRTNKKSLENVQWKRLSAGLVKLLFKKALKYSTERLVYTVHVDLARPWSLILQWLAFLICTREKATHKDNLISCQLPDLLALLVPSRQNMIYLCLPIYSEIISIWRKKKSEQKYYLKVTRWRKKSPQKEGSSCYI